MKKIYTLAIIPLLVFSAKKGSAQSKIPEVLKNINPVLADSIHSRRNPIRVDGARLSCAAPQYDSKFIPFNAVDQSEPIKLDAPDVFTFIAIQVERRGIDKILKDFPLLGKY